MKLPLLLFSACLLAATAASAATLGADDRRWIDRCMAGYLKEGDATRRAARIYCTCMHEMVENNEPLTQTEMERLWPPMHRSCRTKAGRR